MPNSKITLTKFILLLIFTTFLGIKNNALFAEINTSKVDSLKDVIKNTNNKENKFNAYQKLSNTFKGHDIEKQEKYALKALDLAKEENSPVFSFNAYCIMGDVEYAKGNYKKAIKHHLKSLDYKEQVKNTSLIGKTYNNLALDYQAKNKIDSALHYYKESLKIKESTGKDLSIGRTLSNMGVLYWKQANYDKALEHFFDALSIKKEHDASQLSISKTLTNIGSIYFMTEKYDLALEYYSKSMAIKKEIGDQKGISSVSNNIASIYQHNRKLDSALIFLEKSLDIKTQMEDKRGRAGVLSNMANIFREQNNFSKALEYNERSLKLRKKINDQNGIASSLTNMGAIAIEQGNLNQAEEYFSNALDIAKPNSYDRILEELYLNLSNLFARKNNYKKALAHHKNYHDIREKLLDKEANKRIEKLEQKYKAKKRKEELKRQKAENKLKEAKLAKSKKYTIGLVILVVLALAVLLLLIYQYNIKKRYNKKLEEMNNDLDRRVKVRTQELQTENSIRQKAENELSESEEKYRTVTETVNAGIAIADVNEKIIYTNNAFTEMLGYQKEELLDQSLDMIVNNKTFSKFKEESQKRKAGKTNTYHVKLHRKDGQELDTILTASPLFNNRDEFVGGVAAITNITDFKKAEEAISSALRKSEKINNITNQYLRNISEDLRIPLNNIAGMSEILKTQSENTLNEEQIKLIDNIYTSAEDIKFELLNMANLAQISKSDIITNLQEINLNQKINQLTQKIEYDKVSVNTNIKEDINIYGDQQIVENILGSLLENAVYHSTGDSVNLIAERDEVKEFAKIEITNTGEPIQREKLEKILNPFDDTSFENPHKEEKQYDFSLVWIRKMLQILGGRLDISTKESKIQVVVNFPLNNICQQETSPKENLFNILQEENKPLLVFSNNNLEKLKNTISHKKQYIEHYYESSHFIQQLNEGKSIPENAVVLIDENLEEPWNIEKTLLELKEQKSENILYIAIVNGSCINNSHLIDIGFNTCISSDNFIEELTNYLDNTKS